MEESHPTHSGWPESREVRLSVHHCPAYSLMLPETPYSQLLSPEMTTFVSKRKQGTFTENCANALLQLGKLIEALVLLMGAHIGIIFI